MNHYFQSVTGAFTFPNLYKKVSTIFDNAEFVEQAVNEFFHEERDRLYNQEYCWFYFKR